MQKNREESQCETIEPLKKRCRKDLLIAGAQFLICSTGHMEWMWHRLKTWGGEGRGRGGGHMLLVPPPSWFLCRCIVMFNGVLVMQFLALHTYLLSEIWFQRNIRKIIYKMMEFDQTLVF